LTHKTANRGTGFGEAVAGLVVAAIVAGIGVVGAEVAEGMAGVAATVVAVAGIAVPSGIVAIHGTINTRRQYETYL
jgi:hypothetical protein